MKIPLYKPYIGHAEENAVLKVLRSGVLSRGVETKKFEEEFKSYVKSNYAIAVSNGTSALHLGIQSLGWKKGDEVITTPFSFIASSNVLLYQGIKPIFVDIDPNTLNIDPKKVEEKITKKTKGLLLVDIFGLPVYNPIFINLKKKYKLGIIEDACEAIGKPTADFPVGRTGDMTMYSFFENKPITSGGEGGMIATNRKDLAEHCISLRDQGRSEKKMWLTHVLVGYNYRITELQAAIGRVQLRRLDHFLKRRGKIADTYSFYLNKCSCIKLPTITEYSRSWFTYWVRFSSKRYRDLAIKKLLRNGIATHVYFTPIHIFPAYRAFGYKKSDFPIAEKTSDTILSLPFFLDLTEKDICSISDMLCK